jgi:hypothetical protein
MLRTLTRSSFTVSRVDVLFNSGQRPAWDDRMLSHMELHTIKRTIAGSWVALTLIIALMSQITEPLQLAIAALAVMPPLALLLLWNEPAQTMTQAINEARRSR